MAEKLTARKPLFGEIKKIHFFISPKSGFRAVSFGNLFRVAACSQIRNATFENQKRKDMTATTEKAMSIEEIKAKYPNEWVLLGDPVIEVTQVLSGVVIFHAKDIWEIAHQKIDWRKQFRSATTVYTGEFPKNRKYWL